MLLAGIQAEFGLDPPIKAFGGDDLGESHLFTSAAIFEGEREVYLFFTPELRPLVHSLRNSVPALGFALEL